MPFKYFKLMPLKILHRLRVRDMDKKPGRQIWLMKSEPDVYSWTDLENEGQAEWDGVRLVLSF